MSQTLVHGSSKTYTHSVGLSCCFRQWRASSHCNKMHGYALQVEIKFEGKVDDKHWIVDFGSLKPFKTWLESIFDHKTIVASDDPHLAWFQEAEDKNLCDLTILREVGCEAFSQLIFMHMTRWLLDQRVYADRVRCVEVVVREHEGNSGYTRITD